MGETDLVHICWYVCSALCDHGPVVYEVLCFRIAMMRVLREKKRVNL